MGLSSVHCIMVKNRHSGHLGERERVRRPWEEEVEGTGAWEEMEWSVQRERE